MTEVGVAPCTALAVDAGFPCPVRSIDLLWTLTRKRSGGEAKLPVRCGGGRTRTRSLSIMPY